jgi:hypothetical protein
VRLLEARCADRRVADLELAVGRDDVDGVRLEIEALVVAHLDHAHVRLACEDRGQLALVVRRQVHDDHVREP